MSNTDSFIDEVTEDLRRDRLFGYFRRYGWIAGLAVLVLVGGAAWNEYRKARDIAAAEALGDGILAALSQDDVTERVAGLDALSANTPAGAALLAQLSATETAENGESSAAAARLDALATNADLPQIYRDLAAFKALALRGTDIDADARRIGYEALSQPGGAFRLLALEQLAYLDIEAGEIENAKTILTRIAADAEVGDGQRGRILDVMTALGGPATPEAQ